MHCCALVVDLHLPDAHSLKAKRATLSPILEGARRRHRVAAAEVAHQDRWQRSELAFASVAASPRQVTEVLDAVDRFVWSFPEVEVAGSWRRWTDDEEE